MCSLFECGILSVTEIGVKMITPDQSVLIMRYQAGRRTGLVNGYMEIPIEFDIGTGVPLLSRQLDFLEPPPDMGKLRVRRTNCRKTASQRLQAPPDRIDFSGVLGRKGRNRVASHLVALQQAFGFQPLQRVPSWNAAYA